MPRHRFVVVVVVVVVYCCFGGLKGPPRSQMVDVGPLVRDGVGWVRLDGVGGVLG